MSPKTFDKERKAFDQSEAKELAAGRYRGVYEELTEEEAAKALCEKQGRIIPGRARVHGAKKIRIIRMS